ncbi:30S ribosomal protein S6 [Myxococcota bacterium]|nr:30S ribosomal protein S6 [Myxococcota bacterium]
MREYETTFIVQPEITEEGIAALFERLDGILENHESIRLLYDDQGRRRLAYEIQNFQKGRYVCLSYLDDGKVVQELERSLRLDDSILRFLTVQVTDLVDDIEQRKAEAKELERIRAQKAAERAEREAEEAAREAEEAARHAALAAESAAAMANGASDTDTPGAETPGGEAGASEAGAAAVEGEAAAEAAPVPAVQESADEEPTSSEG